MSRVVEVVLTVRRKLRHVSAGLVACCLAGGLLARPNMLLPIKEKLEIQCSCKLISTGTWCGLEYRLPQA